MTITNRPARLLIVDDQEPFRAAVRMMVELMGGFEVVGEALDGPSALELADELAPDLVLVDVKMPGMDGFETTRRLTTAHEDLRVIVTSTYHADEYEGPALDAGAVAFVSKSDFGPEVLLSFVATGA